MEKVCCKKCIDDKSLVNQDGTPIPLVIEMEDKGELPGKTRLSLDENKAVFILPNEHLYQCPSCKDIIIK